MLLFVFLLPFYKKQFSLLKFVIFSVDKYIPRDMMYIVKGGMLWTLNLEEGY